MGTAEALGGPLNNQIEHIIRIGIQRGVPNPQNRPALVREESIAPNIALAIHMRAPVQLNDQPRLTAGEIGDVGSDRQLTGEPRPKPRNQMP